MLYDLERENHQRVTTSTRYEIFESENNKVLLSKYKNFINLVKGNKPLVEL